MSILVTGANGQLGSELQRIAKEFPLPLLFHDIDTLDITDSLALQQFCSDHALSFIINCAAYTAVDKAECDEQQANRLNHGAVKNLRNVSDQFNIRIVHLSTDYIFDGSKNTPYTEDDKPAPLSVYGMSKLKGEYELLSSPRCMIIRTSWLYSSFGNNFVKTILRHAAEKEALDVVYDQTGVPTYGYDLGHVLLFILSGVIHQRFEFVSGIFNYSNEGVCSWFDFAREIIALSGMSCKVRPILTSGYPLAARRPAYSVLAKEKIKKTFGIQIPYWKDSLRCCINEIQNKDK